MSRQTYTATAHGRTITCEVVHTWELEEGDALYHNGAFMVCGPFEDALSKFGTEPEYDRMGARWCTAMITSDPKASAMPMGWLGKTEDGLFRTWRIQGNTRASWSRILTNVPAKGDQA